MVKAMIFFPVMILSALLLTWTPVVVRACDLQKIPVEAFEALDVKAFAERTRISAAQGKPWSKDPLQAALTFVGTFEGKHRQITTVLDQAESPATATITIIEDGYLDDSVRGAWYKLRFEVDEAGVWHLKKADKAWRCYRGARDAFTTEMCR